MRVMTNPIASLKTYKSKNSDHNSIKSAEVLVPRIYLIRQLATPVSPSTPWICGIIDYCNVGHHIPQKIFLKIHI